MITTTMNEKKKIIHFINIYFTDMKTKNIISRSYVHMKIDN